MKVTGLSPGAKKVLVGLVIIAAVFAVYKFVIRAPKEVAKSQILSKSDIKLAEEATSSPSLDASKKLPLPQFNQPVNSGTRIIFQGFEWNAQFPLMLAMGGQSTSKGSLFEKYNLDVEFKLQPDVFKTVTDFIKNTQDLKSDPSATPMIWAFMGNGAPLFSVMTKELRSLGEDGAWSIIYFQGRSAGEDGFWGPAEWKDDPQLARGKGVAFVEKDGDADIPFQWCADNKVPINANTKVYDPEALNVIAVPTYTEAGERYLSGITEDRVLVRNGKTVPDSVIKLKADSYSSWTPVDVTVAQKKGGLIRLASTKEYTSLMPNAIAINKKWAYSHRKDVENFIRALGEAGDQVRSFPEAARFAARVSALVYADDSKDENYWLRYYTGVREKDFTGALVELGGSKAFNLADAANVFGLGSDRKDRFKVTFETVVKTWKAFYPDDVKDIATYQDIVDKSFLMSVLANSEDQGGQAEEITYSEKVTNTISNKSVTIEFDNNSAEIKPASFAQLNEIYNSAVIAEGLTLQLVGHTNAVGSDDVNQPLSLRRAQAVRNYLIKKGLSSKQVAQAEGAGSSKPLEGSNPADPKNRRVEVIFGQ